jgi:hypothetical protein
MFPKTANPAATLAQTNPDSRLVQSSNARLSKESLLKGFEKIWKHDRQKWLADIKRVLVKRLTKIRESTPKTGGR